MRHFSLRREKKNRLEISYHRDGCVAGAAVISIQNFRNDMSLLTRQRPWGFRDFVKAQGYCSLYLLIVADGCPIKVGITEDPVRRLGDFQNANWRPVEFHRVWWLPGQAIALRIENAFKHQFERDHVRGEWFGVTLDEAVDFVEDTIAKLGTWGITQDEIEERMMHWARKLHDLPRNAPTMECGLRTMRARSRR